jgi:dTDP-4-dehydrorhamnose reductase
MRIVVTGVAGQIGGALVSQLQGQGEILAADRAALDLAKPQTIPAALESMAPEVIVNAAAYTAVDKAEEEPALALCVNGEAPGVIARWAAARAIPLIHFSTDYVFDGSGDKAWREDDPTGPLSSYGASKLAGEKEIRAAGGSFLIVRTSWVYAAHGTNFLRTIVRLAQERKDLRIVSDQIGAPTSAALIATAIAGILSQEPDKLRERCSQAHGLVHLAASGETSWHGFATAIADGLRSRGARLVVERIAPISTDEYPVRARRPYNSRLDTARWHKVFDLPLPHWQAALAPELEEIAQQLQLVRDRGMR